MRIKSLRCLIAWCNPFPFKILQFWRRWCATMWGRAITPSTLQSTLWLGAEVGIRFGEANKRIPIDITLTLMQADSKIPSKFFPFTNIFMIKPFSLRHACTRRHILHLMVPSSRWGAPVWCIVGERWLDGRSWLLVMTFWWESSDFRIAGQEDWDPWMLWGKIDRHEVSTSLVACWHFCRWVMFSLAMIQQVHSIESTEDSKLSRWFPKDISFQSRLNCPCVFRVFWIVLVG